MRSRGWNGFIHSTRVIEFVMKSSAICRLRNCFETEAPPYHRINSLADAVKMVLVAVGVWPGALLQRSTKRPSTG